MESDFGINLRLLKLWRPMKTQCIHFSLWDGYEAFGGSVYYGYSDISVCQDNKGSTSNSQPP